VIEHVGAATWTESMKALKLGGTLVTAALHRSARRYRPTLSYSPTANGSGLYGTMGELHEVLKHVFSGKLKAVVDRTFRCRRFAPHTNTWKTARCSARSF